MRTSDVLLLAPTVVCGGGLLAYVLTDMRISQLCLVVAGLSCASLVLHWVITRAQR